MVSRIFETNHLLMICDPLDSCPCVSLLGLLGQRTPPWVVQTTEMSKVKVLAGEVPSEGREGGCSSPLRQPLAFAGDHWSFRARRGIALVSAWENLPLHGVLSPGVRLCAPVCSL